MASGHSQGNGKPPGGGHSSGGHGGEYSEGKLLMVAAGGFRNTFSSLSGNRDFTYLFSGNVGFFFGMSMMMLLRGWLVIDEWESPALLGYLMLTMAGPMLFLSPIAGVVTDRFDKRKILLAAQSSLVLSNAVIAVLILTGTIEFWQLIVVSTLSGMAFSFNMPGRQAMIAQLVPREQLMNAMALSTAMMNASRIVAPPIAGLLVSPIGIGGAYLVTTGFYAVAVVATYALPTIPPKREDSFTFFQDFVGGFSYIRRTPMLVALLLFATVPMIFAMPYVLLMPVFANDVWNVGSSGLGVLQSATGVGGLIGALIVANLDSYPKKSRLLLAGGLAFGGFLILFAYSPSYYVALALLGAVGFGSMIAMTVNNTAIQLIIPDEVRGRVMSFMMMTWGLMPLGGVPAGIAAEHIGVEPVVAIGGALCVIAVLLLFMLLPAFRSLDEELQEGRARQTARMEPGGQPPQGAPVPAAEASHAR